MIVVVEPPVLAFVYRKVGGPQQFSHCQRSPRQVRDSQKIAEECGCFGGDFSFKIASNNCLCLASGKVIVTPGSFNQFNSFDHLLRAGFFPELYCLITLSSKFSLVRSTTVLTAEKFNYFRSPILPAG